MSAPDTRAPGADPLRSARISEGEAPFVMDALIARAGPDILIRVTGGTRPHIGSVAVSLPRESLDGTGARACTTSAHNLLGHKDDRVAVPFAEAFCKAFGCVTVVSAGVHIDGASASDTEAFLGLSERLLRRALALWRDG